MNKNFTGHIESSDIVLQGVIFCVRHPRIEGNTAFMTKPPGLTDLFCFL